MHPWISNWLDRHQHPASRFLHAIAIPLLPIALALGIWQLATWRWDIWYRPALLFAVSYLVQWVGHTIEGNDMGEIILIKKWLGKPYIAVAPRYASRQDGRST